MRRRYSVPFSSDSFFTFPRFFVVSLEVCAEPFSRLRYG